MKKQAVEVLKTAARVFVGTLLAAAIAAALDGLDVFTLSWEVWQPFVAAAAAAAGTVVVNALNPADTRYGVNADG